MSLSKISETKAQLQGDASASPNNRLTNREMDLLRLIAHDKSNKEIAVQLFISESTVKKNITDLLVKLNLRDRVQLALYALIHGLVEQEELNL